MTKILNFGSINFDYVYRVPRFIQPGETMASTSKSTFAGGKGLNQSIALASAGAQIWHAGRVAEDAAPLIAMMEKAGVHTELVDTTGAETGHAIIQVDDSGQNCIMLYQGANHAIEESYIRKVLENFSAGDFLVLQNEINNIELIMQIGYEKGMQIALNPSPIAPGLTDLPLEKVSWFLMNEIEGKELTGESEPRKILDVMLEKYPDAHIVLTLGHDGSCYRDKEQQFNQGIFKVKAVDTTAAGDTFTGFLIQGIVEGKSVPEALRCAAMASAIAVSRSGAAPSIPTMQEVKESELNQQ